MIEVRLGHFWSYKGLKTKQLNSAYVIGSIVRHLNWIFQKRPEFAKNVKIWALLKTYPFLFKNLLWGIFSVESYTENLALNFRGDFFQNVA